MQGKVTMLNLEKLIAQIISQLKTKSTKSLNNAIDHNDFQNLLKELTKLEEKEPKGKISKTSNALHSLINHIDEEMLNDTSSSKSNLLDLISTINTSIDTSPSKKAKNDDKKNNTTKLDNLIDARALNYLAIINSTLTKLAKYSQDKNAGQDSNNTSAEKENSKSLNNLYNKNMVEKILTDKLVSKNTNITDKPLTFSLKSNDNLTTNKIVHAEKLLSSTNIPSENLKNKLSNNTLSEDLKQISPPNQDNIDVINSSKLASSTNIGLNHHYATYNSTNSSDSDPLPSNFKTAHSNSAAQKNQAKVSVSSLNNSDESLQNNANTLSNTTKITDGNFQNQGNTQNHSKNQENQSYPQNNQQTQKFEALPQSLQKIDNPIEKLIPFQKQTQLQPESTQKEISVVQISDNTSQNNNATQTLFALNQNSNFLGGTKENSTASTQQSQALKMTIEKILELQSLKPLVIKSIQLQLNPPTLGNVDIKVSINRNRELNANIHVESQEIFNLLNNNLDTLRATLQNQGVNVTQINISSTNQNTQNFNQNSQNQSQTFMQFGNNQQFNQNNQGQGTFNQSFNQSFNQQQKEQNYFLSNNTKVLKQRLKVANSLIDISI